MSLFQIVIRTCAAPKSGGGKYRRPVRLLVVAGPVKSMYRKDDPAVLAEWSNLDSRYNGPKSEYGQYRAKAQAMVERLEAAIPENFRAMFAEHPNERGVRLVLADWCEEQGMPDVGAALRA